eukprot:TRINITY_DN9678_c0_g2_i1.p1 TRINITY_DN9678_c0_g2~~TRINITY_DN9678_c0_g2_i1.p1  ORF type:complete len:129 (-),score=42.60 TRINITY_DN9678_c0_g2_i1:133-519(-)
MNSKLLLILVSFAIFAFVSAERRPARKISLAEWRISKLQKQDKNVDEYLNNFKKKDPILAAIIEEYKKSKETKHASTTLIETPEKIREARRNAAIAAFKKAKEEGKLKIAKTLIGYRWVDTDTGEIVR